jgi:cytochrome b involved in lipid metabolism
MELSEESDLNFWILEGKLYDLSEYINYHPGGKSWLINTRGQDIT